MSLVLAKRPPLTDAPASKYYSETSSQYQRNHLVADTRSQGSKRTTVSPSAEEHHQKNPKRHHQHFHYNCGIVNTSRDSSSSSSFTTYTTSSSSREPQQQQQQHIMPSAFGLLEGTEDRRPDLVGSHGGFGHLVSTSSGSFSSAPRLSHTPAGAGDFQPPYFPPPYQPQQAMDFHHHQVDPYGHVNPFQQSGQHYNQLHPTDRSMLARREEHLNMHPGLGYDSRRPDYMSGLRRHDVLHHGPHPGLSLDQDPSLLSLHANHLGGLEDANQPPIDDASSYLHTDHNSMVRKGQLRTSCKALFFFYHVY
ncbi:hypothetical protein BsWGS_03127 [Bradybaena similaris]